MKYLTLSAFFFIANTFAAPEWTTSLDKNTKLCNAKKEICAVGEGESISFAKINARAEIAKFFSTKIESEFETSLQVVGNDIKESANERVKESTEEVIDGVEIRKTDEDKVNYYALAVLNKSKARKVIRKKVSEIDEKMKALRNEKDQKSIFELESLYVERSLLTNRIVLLSGISNPSPITFEEILKRKKKLVSGVRVLIQLKEEGSSDVSSIIKQEVSSLGYETVTDSKQATHILTGQFYPEKKFLNVDGFEKYGFILKMNAMNKSRISKGSLSQEFVAVGRDYRQAYEKAKAEVVIYLKQNMKKLSFK